MKREASSAFRAAVLRRASVLRKDAQRTLDRQPVFVEHDPQHGRRPSELLARFRAESHVGEVGGIRWCVADQFIVLSRTDRRCLGLLLPTVGASEDCQHGEDRCRPVTHQ